MTEFYVAPGAIVCERWQLTDDEAAVYRGPYQTRVEAELIAGLIRTGELAPTRVAAQASTPFLGLSTAQRGIALTVISGIAMTVGIIMTSATSSASAVCNSGIGQLNQAFSSTAQNHCATGAAVHTSGVIVLVLGILGIVGGMATLFGNGIRHL